MTTQPYLKFLFFLCISLIATSVSAQDTDKSITLQFNKIRPFVEEFNVEMKANFTKDNNMFNLQFTVPNYLLRYKTTIADYVILETASQTVKLQNEKEIDVEEGSICMGYVLEQIYTFRCSMPKDKFVDLLNANILKITFCFAPNEDFIKSKLANEKFMHIDMVRWIARFAKKTIKVKALQPDAIQYEKLVAWVQQLK